MTDQRSAGDVDETFEFVPRFRQDLEFEIAALDAFHLVVGEETYWQDFKAQDRVSTDRFLLKPGWRTVYGRRFETALVKVTLSDGSTGWGEATEPICPEVVCSLAVRLLAPILGVRRWKDPAEFWQAAYDLNRARGHHSGYLLLAIAAVEVAVWDALSRRAGMPLAKLIAEKPAELTALYVSGLRRGTTAERIEFLRGSIETGFAGAKIFVDSDTSATLKELADLRNGVPGNWKLMVDALWSYNNAQSAALARKSFADFDVSWFECPLISEDLEAHRELARGKGVPIALGEHFFTHYQSEQWLQAEVLDIFQPDICRTGISGGLQQAAIALKAGIRVTPHMGSGSQIVQAVALQFSAVIGSDEPCEYQIDLAEILPTVFRSEWHTASGRAELPDAPGIGVTIDESELASHSSNIERWVP